MMVSFNLSLDRLLLRDPSASSPYWSCFGMIEHGLPIGAFSFYPFKNLSIRDSVFLIFQEGFSLCNAYGRSWAFWHVYPRQSMFHIHTEVKEERLLYILWALWWLNYPFFYQTFSLSLPNEALALASLLEISLSIVPYLERVLPR